jgi:Flp pilus assembly protein TadD
MAAAKFAENGEFQCAFFEKLAEKCADDLVVLRRLGELYSANGRIQDGLRTDVRASLLAPEDPHVHYNLACSFALSEQPQFAMEHLKLAIKLGFRDIQWLLQDRDLESLHHLIEFRRIVHSLRRETPPPQL